MKNQNTLRDEMRRVEQIYRTMTADEFMASPVLDEKQWEIDRLVRQRLSAKEWNLFAGVCLSAFFDPLTEKYSNGRKGDRDLVLTSSILFAVATVQPFCRAVLMVIESGQPRLEAFLDREEARWIRYAPLLNPSEFAEQMVAAVEHGDQIQIGQREKVNASELQVWRGLINGGLYELEKNPEILEQFKRKASANDYSRALTGGTSRLLQEVALDRLRPVHALSLSKAADHISNTSSLDILVHSRGKAGRPLLGIEVDGSSHNNPQQIAKDRAKDEVMDAFRIPLIRITQSDADFWPERGLQPKGGYEKLARFTRLIVSVANHISFQVQIEDQLAVEQNLAGKLLNQLEEKLAKSNFGTAYVNLDSNQRDVIYESSVVSPESQAYELVADAFEHHKKINRKETELACLWPLELKAIAAEPQIFGHFSSGLTAQTLLNLPGCEPMELKTPSVRISANHLDEASLLLNLQRCLVEDLADEVRVRLRH